MAGLGLLLFVAFVLALAVQVWALVDAARQPEEHLAQRGGKSSGWCCWPCSWSSAEGSCLGSCTWWPYDLAECAPIWASATYPHRGP